MHQTQQKDWLGGLYRDPEIHCEALLGLGWGGPPRRRCVSEEELFEQAAARACGTTPEEQRAWTGPERFFYDTTTYTGIHRRDRQHRYSHLLIQTWSNNLYNIVFFPHN